MAVGIVMQFSGVGAKEYDAVNNAMGRGGSTDPKDWPEEVISHVAGPTAGGWMVVDIWKSRAAFDKFAQSELMPAAAKAGLKLPPPTITEFEVYKSYRVGG